MLILFLSARSQEYRVDTIAGLFLAAKVGEVYYQPVKIEGKDMYEVVEVEPEVNAE